ncbi:MAG: tetratricopeptide repeat protein [Polyangiaceae bacterium]|nr:tetratricopeptide repeat protein [Polyangiaceae bacterium]
MRRFAPLLSALLSVSVALPPAFGSSVAGDSPSAPASSGAAAAPQSGNRSASSRSEAVAHEEFAAGQRLFDQKKLAEALVRFRKAYDLSASPNAHLMVARSLLALGRRAEAYEEMAATMREATSRAENEPKYIPTRDAAAAELALLEGRVGKVIVVLVEPTPGVEVALNGARLSPQRVGVPVAVEPGSVAVAAEREGKPLVRRDVNVRAGETKTVAISFEERSSAAGSEPIARRDEAASGPSSGGPAGSGLWRSLGYGVAGAGVAGFVTFGVAGLTAQSKFNTLQEECGGRCSDPKYASVVDMGKTLDTVANIGLAVGIAGVAGGAALIVFGGPSSERRAPAKIGISPGPLGVRVTGSF